MDGKKETWSYDFSWTQPYVSMEGFFKDLAVEQENESLDKADEAVQNMLTYPDAERIMNKITKEIEDD